MTWPLPAHRQPLCLCALSRDRAPGCVPFFWPEPVSVFASSMLTMPMTVHMCWTYPSARPSHRFDDGSVVEPLAGLPLSNRQRARVSVALDPAVTSYADAGRLLRTEPQVQLQESSRVEQSFKRLQVAPGLSSSSLSPAPLLCPSRTAPYLRRSTLFPVIRRFVSLRTGFTYP